MQIPKVRTLDSPQGCRHVCARSWLPSARACPVPCSFARRSVLGWYMVVRVSRASARLYHSFAILLRHLVSIKNIRYDADAAGRAVGQGNPHLHSTQRREWGEAPLMGQEPSGWGSGQSRISSLGDPIREVDRGKDGIIQVRAPRKMLTAIGGQVAGLAVLNPHPTSDAERTGAG